MGLCRSKKSLSLNPTSQGGGTCVDAFALGTELGGLLLQGTSKNLALRQAQCERHNTNQNVPFVLSLSKQKRNGFF